jgi:nucleoside 2-deoxyribosyltransferase
MEGLSIFKMSFWRQVLTEDLQKMGIIVLDPCRRLACHLSKDVDPKSIFDKDIEDINNSDFIIADARRSQGRGTGTSMEIMYAWTKRMPIIGLVGHNDPIHPFYESTFTQKFTDLQSILKASKDLHAVR